MPIEFRCPVCTTRLRVPEGTEGQMTQCPVCGVQTPIPGGFSSETAMGNPKEMGGPSVGEDPAWAIRQSGEHPLSEAETFSYPGMGVSGTAPSASLGFPAGNADWTRQYAYARISAPASWLIVLSAIGFGLGVVCLLAVVLGMAAEGVKPGPQEGAALQTERTKALVVIGLELFMSLVVLWGSTKMKQLESYPWAMTTALLAIVPCLSPCCVAGIPFGIWALVVLTDPGVKAAFR